MQSLNRKKSFLFSLLLAGILSFIVQLSFSSCNKKSFPPFPPDPEDKTVPIHIAIYGGHSGIILPNDLMPDKLHRLTSRFNTFRYIEFGWGDEDFYRGPEVNLFIAVKAALWPTASVLHLIGINETLDEYAAAGVTLYRIEVSQEGFIALCNFLIETFMLDKEGNSIALGPDPAFIVRPTMFYQARPKFFFPRTCNTWTAKALQKAGLPISILANTCVKNLGQNVAKHGIRINLPEFDGKI